MRLQMSVHALRWSLAFFALSHSTFQRKHCRADIYDLAQRRSFSGLLPSSSFLQMVNGDNWVALDKLYHFIFGFCTTVVFTLLAYRARYAFIRSRSIWVGSILSLLAGAAKEAADEMGYFKSAGASTKDAVSDLLGTLVAALALSLSRSYYAQVGCGHEHAGQVKSVTEMV